MNLHITQNITLKEAYDRYITSKQNLLSPNTVREYRRLSKMSLQSIMPALVDELTGEQIQIAINDETVHLSAKSVWCIHGLLSSVLKTYRPDFNLRTTLPPKDKKHQHTPSTREINTLLAAVKDSDMELPIMLAAFGPLRRGEICALTKGDINGLIVTVNKQMIKGLNNEWITKSPKSYAGYRQVELPEFMRPLLDRITDKVTNRTPYAITSKFSRILKDNGIQHFRFHDLRHFCVSYLHAHKHPAKYLLKRGGWSSEYVINNVYNHILSDEEKEINREMNASFDSMFE